MQAETIPICEISEEEELIMTYQVTLCGSDGIVVASDRCELWQEQQGSRSRTGSKMKKIYLSPDGQVAWTFSGGSLSNIAAVYLRDRLNEGTILTVENVQEELRHCGDDATKNFPRVNPVVTDVIVLVMANKRIFRASISTHTAVVEIESKRFISGFSESLAGFIPERFFNEQMGVKELAVLGSYAVRMAHILDRGIDGLDIAIYQESAKRFDFVNASAYWDHALFVDEVLKNCLKNSAIDIPNAT